MLAKIIEDFEKEFPNWKNINSAEFDLKKIMLRWQDPKTADSILKGKLLALFFAWATLFTRVTDLFVSA